MRQSQALLIGGTIMNQVVEKLTKPKGAHPAEFKSVRGDFRVFRVMRTKSLIFVVDDPRYHDIEDRSVLVKGMEGSFSGRLRYVGFLSGELRLDVPIYRMIAGVIGIQRVSGSAIVEGIEKVK
jgi:hypothetical protein